MALTNFILTVAGVSAVVLLLRSDVKQSATIFRRNVKHIRKWLEEESKYSLQFFSSYNYFPYEIVDIFANRDSILIKYVS
jgi:hypothetical protein